MQVLVLLYNISSVINLGKPKSCNYNTSHKKVAVIHHDIKTILLSLVTQKNGKQVKAIIKDRSSIELYADLLKIINYQIVGAELQAKPCP